VLKVPSVVAIVVVAAQGSFAADLPAPIPSEAPFVSGFSWTGCFAGVHSGGTFGHDEHPISNGFNASGFLGGGQAGCDYQFGSALVMGAEARVARTSLNGGTSDGTNIAAGVTAPAHFTVNNNFLASATARAGYSFAGGVLVYARGGAAFAGEKADEAFTDPILGPVDASASSTRAGWTAGAGVDWAFLPHWSMEVKYDYYDFGNNNFVLNDPTTGATVTGSVKYRLQTVTIGSSYHF